MNTKVDAYIKEHEQDIIKSLQDVIRIPSVKGEPAEGAPFGKDVKRALTHTLNLCKEMGFETTDMEGYIGCVDFGEGEETLGIMCHLDVVPEGDVNEWTNPPYAADIVDGNMIGRGTLDDKGPAIATIYALKAIKEAGLKFKRKVRILLGCDEESGWGCMDYYNAHAKMPEMAFSPDAEYPVVNSEKGIMQPVFKHNFASKIKLHAGTRANVVAGKAVAFVPFENITVNAREGFDVETKAVDGGTEITVRGLDAHASTPELGKNALQAMFEILAKLPLDGEDKKVVDIMHENFKMEMHGESIGLDKEDESGRLTLNLGVMDWNENGIDSMSIDVRHPVVLSGDDVLNTLKNVLKGFEVVSAHVQNSHFVPKESELVSKLLDVYAKREGVYREPLAIGGGTYARCIDNAVAFGCERPGSVVLIHMPNEFIPIEDLLYDTYMIADAIIALACEE